MGSGRTETYVDGCLDARFRAGALKDDIEAGCGLVEGREGEDAVSGRPGAVHGVLVGQSVFLGGSRRRIVVWCKGGGGGIDDMVDEARTEGKVEAGGVDVDTNDVGRAEGAEEGAGEEADGASAEDEGRRAGGEGGATRGVEDDGEGLGEGGLLEGDAWGEGMEPLARVVERGLEGAVEVGGRLGGGAEAHLGAEVVPALGAVRARLAAAARDPALDRDVHPDVERRGRAGAEIGNDAGGFVAEAHRVLEGKGTVCTLRVVVHWGANDVRGTDDVDDVEVEDIQSEPQRVVASTRTWA